MGAPPAGERPLFHLHLTAGMGQFFKQHSARAGVVAVATACVALAVGCGAQHPGSHASGPDGGSDDGDVSVGLLYALSGGEHVSAITYTLSNSSYTRSGMVNVASSAAPSFVVAGVPAGSGYGITLGATTDDGQVTCKGSVGTVGPDGGSTGPAFSVANRVTTAVSVQLVCIDLPNQDAGGVIASGTGSCCPTWDTVVAFPSALSLLPPNNSAELAGHAKGPCPGLSCVWSLVSGTGTLSGQTLTASDGYTYATFTCPSGMNETDTLQLVCTDGPLPDGGSCPASSSAGTTAVTCTGTAVGYSVVRHGAIGGFQFSDGIATPVFVENHALDLPTTTDTLLSTIALPTSASGAQQPFAYQGVAGAPGTNDGAMSRSVDGHCLTLVGYGATPGRTGIVTRSSPSFPRVVARIDASGNVDTSTFLAMPPDDGGTGGAFQGSFVRSSATVDGTGFWVGGGSGDVTGGVWYVPFGAAGGGTQLNASLTRFVGVSGGQLYGDSDPVASMPELFTVGSGLPTTGNAPDVGLQGFPMAQTPTATISAWAFAFADPNTLYIATDQAIASGNPPNGVQKWTLSAGTWSLQTTFNLATGQSVATPVGFRGVAVLASRGTSTTFVASTVEPPANHLAVFVDNGGPYAGGASGVTDVGILVAQAPTSTLYKGLALSPR